MKIELNKFEKGLNLRAELRLQEAANEATQCRRLDAMAYLRRAIIAEEAIRRHRDTRGDDRCWRDDDELYLSLPEGYTPPARDSAVELEQCRKYIECRHSPFTTYVSPQRRIEELEAELRNAQARIEGLKTELLNAQAWIERLVKRILRSS